MLTEAESKGRYSINAISRNTHHKRNLKHPESDFQYTKVTPTKMNKLLIIDGHNLLFQMFYGMPNRIINSNGTAVHGVIGFIGALNKMLSQINPSHVIVVFDGETCNPRKQIDDAYKANRQDFSAVPDNENPFTQLPLIYRALDEMHIAHHETIDCEADDIIAAYAQNASSDLNVIIASFDSDFFQLIDDNVTVFRYRGKSSIEVDKQRLWQKLAISPCEYALHKSICGDKADNIVGIRGIGAKTASKIVCGCSTPSQLFKKNKSSTDKLSQKVLQNEQLIQRNYQLINLSSNTVVPEPLHRLCAPTNAQKTMDVLRAVGLWN